MKTLVAADAEIGNESSKILVVGGGYVGLPTAGVLARFGNFVTVAERDPQRLQMLEQGKSPHIEKDLEELLQEGLSRDRLKFVLDAADVAHGAGVIFICVPTPQSDDGTTDLSYLLEAVKSIGPKLRDGAIVVIKSTVPVGTADLVFKAIDRHDVSIVSNPEFLSTGTAVAESLNPERIVVGAKDRSVAEKIASLFEATGAPVVITSNETAETIKYAANAFLAIRLSFSNEVSRFCEKVGADIIDLLQGLGHDHRIGFSYLQPGPGWGGSCLPKDTASLIMMGRANGFSFSVLESAVSTNNAQLDHVVDTIISMYQESPNRNVALWGLTFKSGTDDRRHSPAIHVAQRLRDLGFSLKAYDPTVVSGGADDLAGIDIVGDAYSAAKDTSLVVVLTDWPEFRELDWEKVASVMTRPFIYDTRNCLNRTSIKKSSLQYRSIGTI